MDVVAVQKENSSIQSVRMNVHTVLQHQRHHPMVSFINTYNWLTTNTFRNKCLFLLYTEDCLGVWLFGSWLRPLLIPVLACNNVSILAPNEF